MFLPERVQPRDSAVVRARPFVAVPSPRAEPPADFLETFRKVWRHRGIIFLCMIGFAIISVITVKLLPAKYLAEARVLVGVPTPRALSIESIISDVSPDAERVQSEGFVIQSRELARTVSDRLRLTEDPEFNPAIRQKSAWQESLRRILDIEGYLPASWKTTASKVRPATSTAPADTRVIDNLLTNVSATTLGRSHVLSIQVEAHDPDKAAAIANAFAEAYLTAQRGEKVATADEVEKFLQSRIGELRQQVEKSEQAVEDYRRQNGLYQSANTANTNVTSQQLTELNTQLIIAQTGKAEADARLGEVEAMRRKGIANDSVPDVLRSPLIQSLKEQQAQADRTLAELSSSYGEQHPRVITARAQIADIKRKVETEIGRIVDGLQHEARTADARYEALRQNFEQLKTQMGGVNEKAIHLEALEREATVNRNLLANMLNRSKETLGLQQLQQANAKLISSAAPPESPSFPPKLLIAVLATLAGGLVGILMALLREKLDRTFRRAEEIETLTGLPVLAMIPNVRGVTPAALQVLRHPISSYSEALRKLYIGLQLSEAAQSPRTVMFSSAVPGEGKSMVAASLGRMLASNGKRVLLIDCDWRRPTLHRIFGCQNRGGLAALLDDTPAALNDIIHSDDLSGVDVIVAGEMTMKSMHTLMSERMRIIVNQFAKRYDLVILDSSPVLVGSEVLTLSRFVDKVIFSVRWGHTQREAAFDALKQLIEAQADVAGTMLSRVDPKRYRRFAYGHLNYEYERTALAS
jgi:polysaccharide biosynthesis transport protein